MRLSGTSDRLRAWPVVRKARPPSPTTLVQSPGLPATTSTSRCSTDGSPTGGIPGGGAAAPERGRGRHELGCGSGLAAHPFPAARVHGIGVHHLVGETVVAEGAREHERTVHEGLNPRVAGHSVRVP